MTGEQIVGNLLWRNAMERMTAANAKATDPIGDKTKVIAVWRLATYFTYVERMIERNPTANTPGDRKRQAVLRQRTKPLAR